MNNYGGGIRCALSLPALPSPHPPPSPQALTLNRLTPQYVAQLMTDSVSGEGGGTREKKKPVLKRKEVCQGNVNKTQDAKISH